MTLKTIVNDIQLQCTHGDIFKKCPPVFMILVSLGGLEIDSWVKPG